MKSVAWVLLGGCTVLGDMPATTGVTAMPVARPSIEAQAGFVPDSTLSAAVSKQQHDGNVTLQLAGLVEPDRWIGVPGLIVGLRAFGAKGDTAVEPMAGYRRALDENFAVAAIAFGTRAHGVGDESNTTEHASYRATRGGGEVAIDARAFALASWLSLDVQVGIEATAISAHGTYCVDANGIGETCENGAPMVSGSLFGVYPAGNGTVALDLHTRNGTLQRARLALIGAVGRMPRAVDGRQQWGQGFASWGLLLTVGAGE